MASWSFHQDKYLQREKWNLTRTPHKKSPQYTGIWKPCRMERDFHSPLLYKRLQHLAGIPAAQMELPQDTNLWQNAGGSTRRGLGTRCHVQRRHKPPPAPSGYGRVCCEEDSLPPRAENILRVYQEKLEASSQAERGTVAQAVIQRDVTKYDNILCC